MRSEYKIINGTLYEVHPHIAGVVDSYTLCSQSAYDFLRLHYNIANGTHPSMIDNDYVTADMMCGGMQITRQNIAEFEFSIYFED